MQIFDHLKNFPCPLLPQQLNQSFKDSFYFLFLKRREEALKAPECYYNQIIKSETRIHGSNISSSTLCLSLTSNLRNTCFNPLENKVFAIK